MSISINSYVCNLIAGKSNIEHLYYSVDRARDQKNRGKTYCAKINLPGVGVQTYNAPQLTNLDSEALQCSMNTLLARIDGVPTVSQLVSVLLKARSTIQPLFQARQRAMFMRSTARIFCYTFNNPFGSAAGVNRSSTQWRSANAFLTFFERCLAGCSGPFDATLILGGLLD